MTDAEKHLDAMLTAYRRMTPERVERAIGALLAEHRAEVEALRADKANLEWRVQNLSAARAEALSSVSAALDVAGYPCGAATPAERIAEMVAAHNAEVQNLKDALASTKGDWRMSARDAALEEAAEIAHEEHRAAGSLGAQMRTLEVEKRIRALQSASVSVLPVDKVRAALRIRFAEQRTATHPDALTALAQVARDLGVDLDAKADSHDCAPSPDETCTHGRWWDSPCSACGRGDVVL